MRPSCVVVGEVAAQQVSEMPFAENDDVIEAFPSNRPDDALGEGILPGCLWGDEDLVDPHAFHASCENVAVDGVAIAEQVLGCGLFWEGLDELLGDPSGGRVAAHIDVEEFAAVMLKDHEPEEQAEGQGRNYEEVNGGDLVAVRSQEGAPGGGGPR